MAIINSYPLATPKLTDLVLGTSTSSTGQTSTKSFTIQSIKDTTAAVKTIVTATPDTLAITGTTNVTINTITAAVTNGGNGLATGNDIYDFVVGKITGTANTVPIWTGTTPSTTLGDSLISQANSGVIISGNSSAQTDGKLTLNCWNGNHGVTIQAPSHSVSATYTLILPTDSNPGAGKVLTSGAGSPNQLSWTDNGNVGGTGTQNKLSKWSTATTLADSNIEDTGTLVTISSAAKVTGDLELDADLIDVNGSTGSDGQLLKSLGGGNLGVEWINAPATGVVTVTSADTDVITVGGTSTNPTIDANTTAGVGSGLSNLATGGQIQTAIDTALAGALTFKGTFNATTGQIVSGSNNGSYLYNCPGGAGTRVAISVGDLYVASTAGSFYCTGSSLSVADEVIATADAAADSSVVGNWSVVPSSGGGITGNGTTNAIPRWDGATVLADSVIAQSGTNIGIGTTSPSALLHVSGSSPIIQTQDTDGTNQTGRMYQLGADLTFSSRNNTSRGSFSFQASNGTDTVERMRIDSAGNVGIGTTSPSAKLHIASTNAAITDPLSVGNALRFTDNDPTQNQGQVTGTIEWETKDSNNAGVQSYITTISSNTGSGNLSFGTGAGGSATERMRIDSSGQVQFNNYTSSSSFTGTAAANLAVDSSGNIITEAAGGSGGGNRTVTIGTGDGTTTDFTMGVAFTSVDYVDVYISGVYQQKATYIQPNGTGTTLLRFTTAPPTTSTNGIDFVINH